MNITTWKTYLFSGPKVVGSGLPNTHALQKLDYFYKIGTLVIEISTTSTPNYSTVEQQYENAAEEEANQGKPSEGSDRMSYLQVR